MYINVLPPIRKRHPRRIQCLDNRLKGTDLMDEAVGTLRKRLALGEIDIVEYEKLLQILSSAKILSPESTQKTNAERLVASFENFFLYESYLQIGGKMHFLADGIAVTSYAREVSFNFIKSLESGFTIKFQGGACYSADNNSTWPFNRERYNKIRQFGATLKAATVQSRMNNCVKELRGRGRILVGHGNNKEPQIHLTIEGKITTALREFDIKACAATGTFGIGVKSINNYYAPNKVLISNGKKPLLGYGKESLSFDLDVNEDVLKNLLLWIAEPGNILG